MRLSTVFSVQLLITAISAQSILFPRAPGTPPSSSKAVLDFIDTINDPKKFSYPACFPTTAEDYMSKISCRALDGFKLIASAAEETDWAVEEIPVAAIIKSTCLLFTAPEVNTLISNCAKDACQDPKDVKAVEKTLKEVVKYGNQVCPRLLKSVETELGPGSSNGTQRETLPPQGEKPVVDSGAGAAAAPVMAGLLVGLSAFYL